MHTVEDEGNPKTIVKFFGNKMQSNTTSRALQWFFSQPSNKSVTGWKYVKPYKLLTTLLPNLTNTNIMTPPGCFLWFSSVLKGTFKKLKNYLYYVRIIICMLIQKITHSIQKIILQHLTNKITRNEWDAYCILKFL